MRKIKYLFKKWNESEILVTSKADIILEKEWIKQRKLNDNLYLNQFLFRFFFFFLNFIPLVGK